MILHRDPFCVICNTEPSTTVDHIKPKAQGGEDTEENLRGVCADCHARKTAADGNAGKRAKKTQG